MKIERKMRGEGREASATIRVTTATGVDVTLEILLNEDSDDGILGIVIGGGSTPVAVSVNPHDLTDGGQRL